MMSVDAPGARRASPLRSATTAPAALASALRLPYASSAVPAAAPQPPAEESGCGASTADQEQAQELLAAGSLRSLEQEDLEGLRRNLSGGGAGGSAGGCKGGGGGKKGGGEAETGVVGDMDSGSGDVQAWPTSISLADHSMSCT